MNAGTETVDVLADVLDYLDGTTNLVPLAGAETVNADQQASALGVVRALADDCGLRATLDALLRTDTLFDADSRLRWDLASVLAECERRQLRDRVCAALDRARHAKETGT